MNGPGHLLELLLGTALRALALGAAMGAALLLLRVRRATVQVCGWMIVLYAAFALPALTWLLPAWTLPGTLPGHVDFIPPAATGLAAPLLLAYALAAAGFLLRTLVGARAIARLRQAAQPIEGAAALECLRGRARACGLERLPQLAASDRAAIPLTTGVWRPVILLPAGWSEWDDAKLRAVLAHELAHVSRGDALAQQCALLYRALFWFSPLSWWLCHRLAELAEEAGDEAALASGAVREDYAELLLQFFAAFARSQRRAQWQALAMAKGGSGAERRVRRILAWRGAVSFRLAESLTLAMALLAMPAVMIAAVVRFRPPTPATPLHAAVAAVTAAPAPRVARAASPPGKGEPALPPAPPLRQSTPSDGAELVTGAVAPADTPEARSAALALLSRARQNSNLEYAGGIPFQLDATLSAQADSSVAGFEVLGGTGQLHEAWSPATGGIWSATLGAATADRLHSLGRVWSTNGAAPVPMRIQTAHTALLAPMENTPGDDSIRTASVSWQGAALECILVTRQNQPFPAAGRAAQEKEFCVDPKSGTLALWSEAPGVYTFFDYRNGPSFHGRALPSSITVWQEGAVVLSVQSIAIRDWADPAAADPTPAMLAQGPSFGLARPERLYLRPAPGTAPLPPVLIHMTRRESGSAAELEILQSPDPARAQDALAIVQAMRFRWPNAQPELYIEVDR